MPKLNAVVSHYGRQSRPSHLTQKEIIEATGFQAFDFEGFPDKVWNYLIDEKRLGVKGSAIYDGHRVPAWVTDNKYKGYVIVMCWDLYKELS